MQKNILLKNYSSYKIGGPASFFLKVTKIDELNGDFKEFKKIFILGGGTNVLLPDKGFDGLVLLNRIGGADEHSEGARLRAKRDKGGNLMNKSEARTADVLVEFGSGMMIDELLDFSIKNSLSGLEWAGGLPGTIGAAVRGNAGAFKGEIKDCVFSVQSFNFRTKKITSRTNGECEFGYRWSVYKTLPSEFITSVVLKLEKGSAEEIKKSINEKIDYRNLKHPMEYPNIGSTFKNIPVNKVTDEQKKEFADFTKDDPFPVVLTTKLLALAGLKGKRIGNAMISDKHPNFIVNLGNAKSSDVLKLIEIARKTVKDKWGIELEEEITHLH